MSECKGTMSEEQAQQEAMVIKLIIARLDNHRDTLNALSEQIALLSSEREMDRTQAKAILDKCPEYWDYTPYEDGDQRATLDGHFKAQELEAIAACLRNKMPTQSKPGIKPGSE
jgi:hypothetical protein